MAKKTSKKVAAGVAKKPPKKAAKKPAAAPAQPVGKPHKPGAVRVRMYRQGLGDCFLLTFNFGMRNAKHMLIDCGSLAAGLMKNSLQAVLADVVTETGGTIDVLVVTHEHKDHLSAFNSEKDFFVGNAPKLAVKKVWLAWTENPQDETAREWARNKTDWQMALNGVAKEIGASHSVGEELRSLADFFGADDFAKTIDEAMDFVRGRVANPEFLEPGQLVNSHPFLGFRFYVLGPPRDETLLKNDGEGAAFKDHLYAAAGLRAPDCEEDWKPFAKRSAGTERGASYDAEKNAWRRIDHDYLQSTVDFALQMDGCINNTSLVLAIERISDRRVMLFPGDAQLGNWLSWHGHKIRWSGRATGGKTVDAADLLHRTVFYKVGHHGSHNATARAGLELMTRKEELVAFISLDRKAALNKGRKGWMMPASNLYEALLTQCGGRVYRSDTGAASPTDLQSDTDDALKMLRVGSTATWKEWTGNQAKAKILHDLTETNLYIDYVLR